MQSLTCELCGLDFTDSEDLENAVENFESVMETGKCIDCSAECIDFKEEWGNTWPDR